MPSDPKARLVAWLETHAPHVLRLAIATTDEGAALQEQLFVALKVHKVRRRRARQRVLELVADRLHAEAIGNEMEPRDMWLGRAVATVLAELGRKPRGVA
jgi:hypothetical protein